MQLKQRLKKSKVMAETSAASSVSPGALMDRNTETGVHNRRGTADNSATRRSNRPSKQMDYAAPRKRKTN